MIVYKNDRWCIIILDRNEFDDINYNVIVGLFKYFEGEK